VRALNPGVEAHVWRLARLGVSFPVWQDFKERLLGRSKASRYDRIDLRAIADALRSLNVPFRMADLEHAFEACRTRRKPWEAALGGGPGGSGESDEDNKREDRDFVTIEGILTSMAIWELILVSAEGKGPWNKGMKPIGLSGAGAAKFFSHVPMTRSEPPLVCAL
jgi:hypothetical protein